MSQVHLHVLKTSNDDPSSIATPFRGSLHHYPHSCPLLALPATPLTTLRGCRSCTGWSNKHLFRSFHAHLLFSWINGLISALHAVDKPASIPTIDNVRMFEGQALDLALAAARPNLIKPIYLKTPHSKIPFSFSIAPFSSPPSSSPPSFVGSPSLNGLLQGFGFPVLLMT